MQTNRDATFASPALTRRTWLASALASAASLALGPQAVAQPADRNFSAWVASFRPRALRRGISEQTYDRVMGAVKPDTSV